MFFENIGELIRYYRQYKGMTQKDVAKHIGVPYQTISRYERNLHKPRIKRYIQLIKYLDVPYTFATKFYAVPRY